MIILQKETYELIAMFMRYWFVFLIVMITFRATMWLITERRAYRKTLRSLPDAGLIGELVDMNTGSSYSLPREGIISSSHSADICLKHLKRKKVLFRLVEGRGIHIHAVRQRHGILLDGEEVSGDCYALHGSQLELGSYQLRFRLFAGLNIPIKRSGQLDENIQLDLYSAEAWQDVYAGMSADDAWSYAISPDEYTWQSTEQDGHVPPLSAPLIPPERAGMLHPYPQDRSTNNAEN